MEAASSAASIGSGGSIFEQLECPYHAARGHIGKVRITHTRDVGTGRTAGHGDILFAVALPRDELPDATGPQLVLPQQLTGLSVHCHELAGELSGEDEPARRHHRAGHVRDRKSVV